MSYPHRCPICFGFGKITWDPDHPPLDGIPSTAKGPWPCKPCKGSGIVWEETTTPAEDDAFGLKRMIRPFKT